MPAPSRESHEIEEIGADNKRGVSLHGEMGDWIAPVAPGIELPVGVYAYKLKVDGVWTLDPANPRTRAAPGGYRNNVLCVGGAPEPLLFAPAPPFVHEDGCGGLVIHAALRRGHGEALTLAWGADGAPQRRAPMQLACEEDEHLVFRARVAGARAHIRFERPDGAPLEGAAFDIAAPAPDPGPAPAPDWWREAVVYTIFVDRFRPARETPGWSAHPGKEPAGGHLEGVRRSLGRLSDLGVTALYLTPIHVGASCHRYDLVDPLRVDPALGGEEAFARLLDDAHRLGLKVLLDLTINHAGRGFPPYEDVIARGAASPYAGYFQWEPGDPPRLRHYGTRTDAPLLELTHPPVEALALSMAERWARAGVDGLRLDAAAEVPIALGRRLRERLRAIRPDAVMLGEVVPAHAWRWRAAGVVDAATELGFQSAAVDWLARRSIDAPAMLRRLAALEVARGGPAHAALRSLSTHDHPRFATLARLSGAVPRAAALGLLLLFTSPGVPALLYGEELGLTAGAPSLQLEDVWPDRMPMPWRPGQGDASLRALTRRLIAARRASPALLRGELTLIHAEDQLLVYRRATDAEIVDIAIHAGDDPIRVGLEDDDLPEIEPLIVVGQVAMDDQAVTLGPGAGLAARRRA